VSIGTITPRAASSFEVTLDTTNPLPAGATVGFYQTLPSTNELPYLIEQKAIDPFTRAFPTDWPVKVSSASIDYGTFSSSGSTVSLSTSNPAEGASTYRLGASAPLFVDGPLTATAATTTTAAVTIPTVNSSTTAAVAIPTLAAASGSVATGLTFQIGHSNTYDKGHLILSHDGAVVATVALDTLLAQGSNAGTLAVSGIPVGSSSVLATDSSALYYVSVRVWSSNNPSTTVKREIYPAPLDLRSTATASYSLNID
jgi:hypothetical protein